MNVRRSRIPFEDSGVGGQERISMKAICIYDCEMLKIELTTPPWVPSLERIHTDFLRENQRVADVMIGNDYKCWKLLLHLNFCEAVIVEKHHCGVYWVCGP
jgi:hypothetical protein